jgi:subtilisin family serine protease
MGTSFASPVIAALAANYLANNPSASPTVVMGAIQAAAVPPTDPTLHAPTIAAIQVCT